MDKVCPKKKRRTKIKANPWYNKTLKALSEKVKKAYKNSKRLLGESKVYYKKLVSKYKKLCKQRRRASWKKYKETRQTVSDMVKLNNIIQKKQRNMISTFKKEDGSNTDPGEEGKEERDTRKREIQRHDGGIRECYGGDKAGQTNTAQIFAENLEAQRRQECTSTPYEGGTTINWTQGPNL